jgi:ribosomal protein L20
MVNLINNPISRERMEQYQNRHLRQVEHAAKQLEARETKVKNSNLRKLWLERQTNANYRNEYDRIRGELAHHKLNGRTLHGLRERQKELQKLFSSGNV